MCRQGIVTALLLVSLLVLPAAHAADPTDIFGKLPEKLPADTPATVTADISAPVDTPATVTADLPAPVDGPATVTADIPVLVDVPTDATVKPGEKTPAKVIQEVTLADSEKGLDATVSVRMRGVNLGTAVRLLAEQAGVNVAVGESVTGTVSCTLTDVTVRGAIGAFLRANGYSYVERAGVLIVVKDADLENFDKNAVAHKIVRKTFRLPYSGQEKEFIAGTTALGKAEGKKTIEDTVRPMLSARGKLIYYPRQNLMVLEDNENVVAMVAEFIAALWATPTQIFIDSKLLEITLEEGEDYGLRWNMQQRLNRNGRRDQKTGLIEIPGTVAETVGPTMGLDRFFSYGFVNANMEVVIEALSTRSRIDLQSNPSVLVMNHRNATIIVGQEVPYMKSEESTGGAAIRTVSSKKWLSAST